MKIEEIKMLNKKYYFKEYEGFWKWRYLGTGIFLLAICAGMLFAANAFLVYQKLITESFTTPLGNTDVGQWVSRKVWRGMFDLGGIVTIINCIIVVWIFLRVNIRGKGYEHYKSWWVKNFPMVCFLVNAVMILISNWIEKRATAIRGVTGENLISFLAIFVVVFIQAIYSEIMGVQETRPQYKSLAWKFIKKWVKGIIDKL